MVSIAKKYRQSGVAMDDLIQYGNLGLLTAVDKFDPERGHRFTTMATFWVRQSITRMIGNEGRTIRLPVHMVDRVFKIRRFLAQVEGATARTPTPSDIAQALDPEWLQEVICGLAREWNMEPSRICAGFLETSLNAPAFSVSVINVTAAAANCRYSVDEIKGFFDARTNTHWESVAGAQATRRRPRREQLVRAPQEERKTVDEKRDLKVDPVVLEKMLRNACEQLIVAEPDLTKWDTVMGDGDCGETLKTGATCLLSALDGGLAKSGSVVKVLLELEDIVESKMGGTLGGILGIFFVSLRAAVEKNIELASSKGAVALWGEAVSSALESLRRYTPAKIGDRTVMDTLIPFAEATKNGGLDHGVKAAVQGAEATKTMTPRLGRATYVGAGVNGNKELPPDPGAWGAMVVVQGLQAGM